MNSRANRGSHRFWLIVAVSAALAMLGCGESQENSANLQRSVGQTPEGAPLGPMVADTGILQDATAYSPAKLPGADKLDEEEEPAAPGGAAATAGGTPEQQALVQKFVAAIEAGNAQDLLALYDPAHVEPLLQQIDRIRPSFEKIAALGKAVEQKMAGADAAALVPGLPPQDSLPIESVDPEHATLAAPLGAIIFGPTRAEMQMQLARIDGEWRFQLSKPLQASEVDAIVAFHDQLQKGFDRLLEWVNQQTTIDPAQLQAAAMAAMTGQPIDLPGAEAEADQESEAGAEKAPPETGKQRAPSRRGPPPKSGT